MTSTGLSKSEIAQGRMIVGTATKRPVISALAFLDREIVDAGNGQAHQAVCDELPILLAVSGPQLLIAARPSTNSAPFR